MQIAIDMPEEVLNSIKAFKGKFICENGYDLIQGIKDGTPLPKGHGRLIDADVLVDGMEDDYEFCEAVNATPTIIESDKR